MKIAVVGCGAMGSIYVGLFSAAGHDVLAVDRGADRVRAINKSGLRIEGASGDRTATLRTYSEAPQERVDLVIVAVKAAQVGGLGGQMPRLLSAGTIVLTIQNGLGSRHNRFRGTLDLSVFSKPGPLRAAPELDVYNPKIGPL